MPAEAKWQPRNKPKPYDHKPCTNVDKDAPKTSAKDKKNRDENITLADWLQVFKWMDDHPDAGKKATVLHFKDLKKGCLVFSQSTLSLNLKKRADLKAWVNSNPFALSSKWEQIVTWPDVEWALFKWSKHMEELVTGAMLWEKWSHFEAQLNVPDKERLPGDGWISSFNKMWGRIAFIVPGVLILNPAQI